MQMSNKSCMNRLVVRPHGSTDSPKTTERNNAKESPQTGPEYDPGMLDRAEFGYL